MFLVYAGRCRMKTYDTAIEATILAARIILESSGETYRAEDTALRMSHAFGISEIGILAFPTGFTIVFTLPDGSRQTRAVRVKERAIRLGNINAVNTVSRLVAEKSIDEEEALLRLKNILASPNTKPLVLMLAFAFASGFFSIMFGGREKEFIICFLCGFVMQGLIPLYIKRNAPSILVALFSGSVASIIALILSKVTGANQGPIITGAIMPLLPGLAMTNAIRDTMKGDLVSGLARGAEALLCAIAVTAGVAIIVFL